MPWGRGLLPVAPPSPPSACPDPPFHPHHRGEGLLPVPFSEPTLWPPRPHFPPGSLGWVTAACPPTLTHLCPPQTPYSISSLDQGSAAHSPAPLPWHPFSTPGFGLAPQTLMRTLTGKPSPQQLLQYLSWVALSLMLSVAFLLFPATAVTPSS